MGLFEKRINRKTYIGLSLFWAFCLTIIREMLKNPNGNNELFGLLGGAFLLVMYLVTVHLRCNDIEGGHSIKLSLITILLSFIPLVSLFVFFYLATTKASDKGNEMQIPTKNRYTVNLAKDLQNKYKIYLSSDDTSMDAQIANDLYEACNGISSLKGKILENNLSPNDFIKFYNIMKCDDVLWDEKEGIYLPFLSILTPDTLGLLCQNAHLPEKEQKQIVLHELNKNTVSKLKENNDTYKENMDKVNGLLGDIKRVWVLVFLLISIGMMVYPPYHTVIPGKGEMFEGYNIIGEAPKNIPSGRKKFTSIDYSTLAFHEVILAVVCCAGYTLTTMVRKK